MRAALVAAVALALSGCTNDGDTDAQSAGPVPTIPSTEPADTGTARVGFIGLPPEGATPSAPDTGKVVAFYWGPAAGNWGKGRYWVYADGRIVSMREANTPEGANELSTGYLEQRLTPAGAERVRAAVVALGVVGDDDGTDLGENNDGEDDDVFLGGSPLSDGTGHVPWFSMAQVRIGDRLFRISRVGNLGRMITLITHPEEWLPASAWADRTVRAYVPTRFAVCLGGQQPPELDPAQELSRLPARVRDVLRADDFTPTEPFGEQCTAMLVSEARTLAAALDEANVRRSNHGELWRLAYQLTSGSDPQRVLFFEPYLPHGEFTCSPCG